MSYKIALWPGDGVGQEVLNEALKVLEKLSMDMELKEFDWNTSLYAKLGRCTPKNYLEELKKFDAILFGALGNKKNAPEHIGVAPLLEMRKSFDQYVNLRPSILFPGVDCPLKNKKAYDVDMVAIRENTEGEYSSLGGRHYPGTPHEAALQVNYFTRMGTERIVRYAFEIARKRKNKRLTSITKSNVLKHSMVFWDDVVKDVAKEYDDVTWESMYVDAAAMNLVRSPENFDVIVSSNLFGDILTDISAVIIGGMGFAGSANINPEKRFPSMFEPVHGSAPDIAGQNIANPVAAILSLSMMLEFLEEKENSIKILEAVKSHLLDNKVKTPDRGRNNSTQEVGTDIASRI